MKSMTYGRMPSEKDFAAHTAEHYPYPMELVGDDAAVVKTFIAREMQKSKQKDKYGFTTRYLGIETFTPTKYPHKYGVRVHNAGAMYHLLSQLAYFSDHPRAAGGKRKAEVAGNLASAIMGTLGYEWV